eukprot:6202962-Pleurochrysis_carterae.AAC.2
MRSSQFALLIAAAAPGSFGYVLNSRPLTSTGVRSAVQAAPARVAVSPLARIDDERPPSSEPGAIGAPYPGDPGLVSEKDGCGVGFLANLHGERTHEITQRALRALGCMEHRGACGGDKVSGDGAGIMTAVPWELLTDHLDGKPVEHAGVGMIFLPQVCCCLGHSMVDDAV